MTVKRFLMLFRPHRLYTVHELRHTATDVARSVVCVSVCLGVSAHGCALQKNSWTDRDAVWGLNYVGPWNHVSDRAQDRTNPLAAARGDKSAMQTFGTLLWTLVFLWLLLRHVKSCFYITTEVLSGSVSVSRRSASQSTSGN